jgi:Ca2+-binding RTX toxin-like protein
MITVTMAAASTAAADLNTIDGKTGVAVDATAITVLTGAAADVKTALASAGITTVTDSSLAVTVSGSTSVADANIINGDSAVGVVTATIVETDIATLATLNFDNNVYTYSISDTSANILAHPELVAGATTVTVTDTNSWDANTGAGDIYNFDFTADATVNLELGDVAIIAAGISAAQMTSVVDAGDDIVVQFDPEDDDTIALTISSDVALNSLTGSELIFDDGSLLKLGSATANTIYGSNVETAEDYLLGAGDNDIIRGLKGDDKLDGGSGADVIYGGAGVDTIIGGLGNDLMYGDAGNDIFVFDSAAIGGDPADDGVYEGSDIIAGFTAGDKLDLTNAGADVSSIVTSGTNSVVTLASGTTVTLLNFTAVNYTDLATFKTDYVVL